MKKFKIFKKFFVFAFVFAVLRQGALAYGGNEKIMWYYKPAENHKQPECVGDSFDEKKDILYIGKDGSKKIYLTFDAGYGNENVKSILDTLKKHGAKAAFFILPGIVKNDLELVKRMGDEGHTVCNHTTSHGDMSKIGDKSVFKKELEDCEKIYEEATGKTMTKYFRPPEGSFSLTTLRFCKELGYTPVFWSFAYKDWDMKAQPDAKKSLDYALAHTHDGMVVLMHPMSKTNALILDGLLTKWEEMGYSFGTLDELKAENC